MSQTPSPPLVQDAVASALNEQGFLFSQSVRDRLAFDDKVKGRWRVVAIEYPVTAADKSQTRVDILLQEANGRGVGRGVFLCVECKRANPLFKHWIFFDRAPAPEFFFESFQVTGRPLKFPTGGGHHAVTRQATGEPQPPTYNLYLEVGKSREGKFSYTDTIETAFRQAVRGQTGVIAKHIEFHDTIKVIAVPIVLTTAKISEAAFDTADVGLATGTISPGGITLHPLDFCAVNYHPDDSLRPNSEFAPENRNLQHDITFNATRTVFVVASEKISTFLAWLHSRVIL